MAIAAPNDAGNYNPRAVAVDPVHMDDPLSSGIPQIFYFISLDV
jgi:hypothetical protein